MALNEIFRRNDELAAYALPWKEKDTRITPLFAELARRAESRNDREKVIFLPVQKISKSRKNKFE